MSYNTIDKRCKTVSTATFFLLFESQELIYTEKLLFIDCGEGVPVNQSEIEDKEFDGEMHDIIFKQENGENLIISTTRPEMIYSCFCIFIHPDDLEDGARYSHLKNSHVYTPLYNKKVPVLADKDTIKDKGTGAMMCCAFGDELDLKRYEKYSEIMSEIFPPLQDLIDRNYFTIQINGTIHRNALQILSNYDSEKRYKIEEFRRLLVEELRTKNLLTRSISVKQTCKTFERSGNKLEILPTNQFCISTVAHKQKLLEYSKQIKFYPPEFSTKLLVWIENLRYDWCISRQRANGIKIPIAFLTFKRLQIKKLPVLWVVEKEIDYSEAEGAFFNFFCVACCKYDSELNRYIVIEDFTFLTRGRTISFKENDQFSIEECKDVLDTWFTSALTPRINQVPDDIRFIDVFNFNMYPQHIMDIRPHAHEIIRTWTFAKGN